MIDLLSWPIANRVTFLRDVWRRAGDEAGGRPIALYGGGRHTHTLLDIVLDKGPGPRVLCILDDHPGATKEIRGIPVRRPPDVSPSDVALVLVSSDSIEPHLAERAAKWVAGTATLVIRPYGEENAAEILAHVERCRGAWGMSRREHNGHLPMSPESLILRLPRSPERGADTELPLPPPELRAGYSTADDPAYLASGHRDVSAILEMVRRHAPDALPFKRVLDWGCSSGRMVRHWLDVTSAGGEVWGCDICAASLNWSSENLAPPFRFFQSTMRPPLPLPDASLDFVYANSVFTHIRELVDTWLMELRRVVRPGGLVWASILDEGCWAKCATNPQSPLRRRCEQIDFSHPLEDDFVCYGGAFDPVTFWHTRGVRRRWSFAFDVVAIEPETVPYQTGVLLRRPFDRNGDA